MKEMTARWAMHVRKYDLLL